MFDWFWRSINDRLDAIEFKLDRILRKENYQMAQQQDIADAIAVMRKDMSDQTTIVGGMSVFIAGIQKQLVDLANASKDTETASALMALAAQAESNTKSLSDAMAANLTGVTPAQAGTTTPDLVPTAAPTPAPQPNPFVDPAPPADPAPPFDSPANATTTQTPAA